MSMVRTISTEVLDSFMNEVQNLSNKHGVDYCLVLEQGEMSFSCEHNLGAGLPADPYVVNAIRSRNNFAGNHILYDFRDMYQIFFNSGILNHCKKVAIDWIDPLNEAILYDPFKDGISSPHYMMLAQPWNKRLILCYDDVSGGIKHKLAVFQYIGDEPINVEISNSEDTTKYMFSVSTPITSQSNWYEVLGTSGVLVNSILSSIMNATRSSILD